MNKSRITAEEIKFLRTTAQYTVLENRRNQDILKEPKHDQFWKKSTITNINLYNMLAGRKDLDSCTLLRNTNQQGRGTQAAHRREFWVVVLTLKRATGRKSLTV
jgi:hypothetical protein